MAHTVHYEPCTYPGIHAIAPLHVPSLQASAAAVGSSLPNGARGYLGYVTSHIGDSQASSRNTTKLPAAVLFEEQGWAWCVRQGW